MKEDDARDRQDAGAMKHKIKELQNALKLTF